MTLDKLKVAARQHEQRDEWRAAIDLYRQAIRAAGSGEGSADPALYNRIGDLEQKAGSVGAACEAWEQAAARYGEQGFFNNAIALCNKILRVDPSRLPAYLELARFQARKRVIYDVRQNLGVYFNQMTARGQGPAAADALDAFAREFSSWKELRHAIDELLGRDSEEDAPPARPGEGARDMGLVFIDTATELRGAAAEPEELVVVPTAFDEHVDSNAVSLDGLESTTFEGSTADPMAEPEGIVAFERMADEAMGQAVTLEGLDTIEVATDQHDAGAITLDGLESTTMDVPVIETTVEVDLGVPASAGDGEGIVFLNTDSSDTGEDNADPLGDRAAGHALLDEGDRSGAIASLERSLEGYQAEEDWPRSWQVATELIQAEPRSIARYQTRVEIAARMRDRDRLCQSYMELGEALVREGSEDKAIAVYRRVLEIDDSHDGARAALRQMTPDAPPSAETAEGFIDLGAMLIDDAPRTTRMRTETTAISADEDETFREALAEFKRALDQNLPVEDHQTHYDLGVAFMEMGLLNEAISEFQKALRSPVGRLRTSEALGQAFFDQGRPAVAEAVLRAVEKGDEGDADKIGVLYWLGRACEAQGKTKNALQCYDRVLAVDVSFRDVTDRITQLGSERGG
jgi:tetratricopeptide (TPR) repeat protein